MEEERGKTQRGPGKENEGAREREVGRTPMRGQSGVKRDRWTDSELSLQPPRVGTSLPPTGWDSLYSTYLNKSFPPAPSSPQTPCLQGLPTCGLPSLSAQRRQKEGASLQSGLLLPRLTQVRGS